MSKQIRQMAIITQTHKINKRLEVVEKKLDKILDKLENQWITTSKN